jgi:hypothetical protein
MIPVGQLLRVTELSEDIGQLLYGQGPEVQGAVLADLLAILIAGHIVPGNAAATAELREALLQHHLKCVRELIPINEEMALSKLTQ